MTIVNNIRSCLHLTTCTGTIGDVRSSALGKIVLTTVPSISKNIGVSGRCSRTSRASCFVPGINNLAFPGERPGRPRALGYLAARPATPSVVEASGRPLAQNTASRRRRAHARVPEAPAPWTLALSAALPWCSFPLFAGAIFRSSPALSLALRRPECRHNGEGSASQAPARSPAQCKRERRGRGRNSAGDARKRTPAKSGREGQRCAKNCAGSRQK